LISGNQSNNAGSTIQYTTLEDPSLGIRLKYPTSWEPIEKTSDGTHVNITEFVPVVQSVHQLPTPFFNILIEDVNNIEIPTKLKQGHLVNLSVNDSALEALTGREIIRLGDTFPDFNIVELNRTFFLSDTPRLQVDIHFCRSRLTSTSGL
jgi:hypothetical protein